MSQGEPSIIDISDNQQGEQQTPYQGEPRYIEELDKTHIECMLFLLVLMFICLFITLLVFVILMNAELMNLEKQNNDKNKIECDKWKSVKGCRYLNWSTSGEWQVADVITSKPVLFGVYMCKNIECRISSAKECYYHVNNPYIFYKNRKCTGSSNKYNTLAMCTLGFIIALFITTCMGTPGHGMSRKIRNIACILNLIAVVIMSIATIIVYFDNTDELPSV